LNLIQIKNDGQLEKSAKFSTGEKTSSRNGSARMAEETEEGFNIGKRTRSGRQARLARPNLNEDELDKEIYKHLEDEEKVQPFSTKRIRQL